MTAVKTQIGARDKAGRVGFSPTADIPESDAQRAVERVQTNVETLQANLEALIASLSGVYQPLDSDLTAIAALTTTAYGRSLLTLASQAALAAEVDGFFLTPAEGNAAYQPIDADLTAIAALTTTAYGRGLLTLANNAALVAEVGSSAEQAAVFVNDYVATPGTGDNTAGVQAAFDAADGKVLVFGQHDAYNVTSILHEGSNFVVQGNNSRLIGTTATPDILQWGNGTDPVEGGVWNDLTIWSAVNRTAGAAFRGRKVVSASFSGLHAGTPTDHTNDGALLWDGIILNEFALVNFAKGCTAVGGDNDGFTAYGNSGQTFGVECVIDATGLVSNWGRDGIHVAGGAGGVKLDCNTQINGRDGLRIDDTLGGVTNREVFLGPNFSADANAGVGVNCHDNSTLLFLAEGSWSGGNGYGWTIAVTQPVGATFRWNSPQIYANFFSGIVWQGGNLIVGPGNIHFNGSSAAAGLPMHGIHLANTAADDVAIIDAPKITNNGNVTHGGYGIRIEPGVNHFNIDGGCSLYNVTGAIDNASGFTDQKRIVNVLGYSVGDEGYLTSLLSADGFFVRRGVADLVAAEIEAGNGISVTDGDGVAGNPIVARAAVPAFRANKNGTDQTGIVSATPTKITFGTEEFDQGGLYDAATNYRWVPPPGKVQVGVRATFANVTGLAILFLFKNGANLESHISGTPDGTGQVYLHVDAIDIANGTDFYEAYAYITTGGTGTVEGDLGQTRFQGAWLGP